MSRFSKRFFSGVSVVLCLTAAGCNLAGSPTDVVGSAYGNLMKGDYAGFKNLLSGDALAQHGAPAAAAKLKQQLTGLKLKVGSASLLSSTQTDVYEWDEVYSVEVIETEKDGQQFVFLQPHALCHVTSAPPCIAPEDPTHTQCFEGQPQPPTRFCSVDTIPMPTN